MLAVCAWFGFALALCNGKIFEHKYCTGGICTGRSKDELPDGTRVRLPARMCDRDTNVTSRYDELDQSLSEHQRLVWSHKTHQAVEALVKNWTRVAVPKPHFLVRTRNNPVIFRVVRVGRNRVGPIRSSQKSHDRDGEVSEGPKKL